VPPATPGPAASPITQWTWTKAAGRALINLGVVILGIVAAKEIVDAGSDIIEAFQSGSGCNEHH
jgi:hypothetical protein